MLFSREMSHLHLFLIWTRLALSTLALTIDEFYQFVPNMTLPQGDDIVSRVTLAQPFLFYGIGYQTVYVTTNGLLSFGSPLINYTPRMDATDPVAFIAPFWGDVDNSETESETEGSGTITFGETNNVDLLRRAEDEISTLYRHSLPPFKLTYLFIVTWDRVGYYNRHNDLVNTFQCVLATDGVISFAFFHYPTNGIQWTAGDSHGRRGRFDASRQFRYSASIAGFNSERSKLSFLPGSGTDEVMGLTENSNVERPGVWIFLVNGARIIGADDPCFEEGVCPVDHMCIRPNLHRNNFECIQLNETEAVATTKSVQSGGNAAQAAGISIGVILIIVLVLMLGIVAAYFYIMKSYITGISRTRKLLML